MDDFHGHDDGFAAADFGIQECGSERGSRHHEESEAGRVEPRAKRARRGSTTTMDEELPRRNKQQATLYYEYNPHVHHQSASEPTTRQHAMNPNPNTQIETLPNRARGTALGNKSGEPGK
ncbi:hypothetical protein E6O75_ATG04502 [Venturia nashicola]|uniref:Uncharacterized protein n=1 Tax=Venturia nashicola TaxID=86259 RepID=A0A4Z1P846_9PEZI|nr:hypothetical protein E6O75_ATG04502 [Venturia nashicola]